MSPRFYVYLMANEPYGTLYVGITNDLARRVWEHREGMVEGFTKAFGLKRLVWFEEHGNAYEAITREKRIKRWHRDWKVNLVQSGNPQWRDLYPEILGGSNLDPGPSPRCGARGDNHSSQSGSGSSEKTRRKPPPQRERSMVK